MCPPETSALHQNFVSEKGLVGFSRGGFSLSSNNDRSVFDIISLVVLSPIFFLKLQIFLSLSFRLLFLSLNLFSYYWHYLFSSCSSFYLSTTFLEAYNTCSLQNCCTYYFFFYSKRFILFFLSFSRLYSLSWIFCFYSANYFRNSSIFLKLRRLFFFFLSWILNFYYVITRLALVNLLLSILELS